MHADTLRTLFPSKLGNPHSQEPTRKSVLSVLTVLTKTSAVFTSELRLRS